MIQSNGVPLPTDDFGSTVAGAIFGAAGNDALFGGVGTDTCNGSTGQDTANMCETVISVP